LLLRCRWSRRRVERVAETLLCVGGGGRALRLADMATLTVGRRLVSLLCGIEGRVRFGLSSRPARRADQLVDDLGNDEVDPVAKVGKRARRLCFGEEVPAVDALRVELVDQVLRRRRRDERLLEALHGADHGGVLPEGPAREDNLERRLLEASIEREVVAAEFLDEDLPDGELVVVELAGVRLARQVGEGRDVMGQTRTLTPSAIAIPQAYASKLAKKNCRSEKPCSIEP